MLRVVVELSLPATALTSREPEITSLVSENYALTSREIRTVNSYLAVYVKSYNLEFYYRLFGFRKREADERNKQKGLT